MLSRKDMAAGLGVAPSLVTRYRNAGMPMTSVADAAAWKSAHVRARVTNGTKPQTNGHQPPKTPPPNHYQDARTRWAVAEAHDRELHVLERRQVLVHREKVRSEVARLLVGLKQALLQLPARLAPVLAAETDEVRVHDILQDEFYAVLAETTARAG